MTNKDNGLSHSKHRASIGACEGGSSCEEGHDGQVEVVRVQARGHHDLGYFAYCQRAITEDQRRGFTVEREGEET